MGIVLKRRDNAQIVKKIYGGVIDIILQKQDLGASIEFLKDELSDLVQGKAPINDLVITKNLRASYKDPSKIAHKVLADRIGARDPGNRPVVNERIPYVYIKTNSTSGLQGDKIENPEFIVENKLIPDYLHYITNQIMKPLLQLYALCLDELPGYEKDYKYWEEIDKNLQIKPIYQDEIKRYNRIDNLKLQMVKALLFDSYIELLSEPKKLSVKKIKEIKDSDGNIVIDTKHVKVKSTKIDITIPDGVAKVDIKITKNQKSGKIIASASIVDNKTKIWDYHNDECINKESETIKIISEIMKLNSEKIYIISLNNKPFVNDYNEALLCYIELMKKQDSNTMENIFETQNLGALKLVNKIRKYSDIILNYKSFSFVIK
jgi:hypothetical protein